MYSGKLSKIWGVVLVFMLAASLFAAIPSGPLSPERIAQAESDVREIYEGGQSGRKELESAFRHVYYQKFPRTPAGVKALDDAAAEAAAAQAVRAELDRHYPVATEEQLKAVVEKAFPIYQKGDRVRITRKKSPVAVETVEGTITDINSGVIRLGQRSIRLRDMVGVNGNEAEILKYDAQASLKRRADLRDEMVRQTQADRAAWMQEHGQPYYERAVRQAAEANEKNGFVYYQERWLSSEEFLAEFIEVQAKRMQAAQQRLQRRRLQAREDALGSRLQAAVLADGYLPPGQRLSPEAEMERRAAAQAAALALAQPSAEELERQAAERRRQEEERRRIEEERMAGRRSSQQRAQTKAQLDAMKLAEPTDVEVGLGRVIFMSPWLAVALGVVVVAGIGALIFLRRREDEKGLDVAKFFEGKGRLQKEFWERADADPEHFKYVAYLFPNLDKANRALGKLSYMRVSREGELSTRHDIEFGAYEHNQGAVCFVGGTKLNYALWREASAVWPELSHAQYFKVSTEPAVQLHLPDIADDLQITPLGQEDFTSDDGAFVRCFRFRTLSIAYAMAFLEKFNVDEEGVMVLVETPEGLLRKDVHGITDESLQSLSGDAEGSVAGTADIDDDEVAVAESVDEATLAADGSDSVAELLPELDLDERPMIMEDDDEPLPGPKSQV